MKLAMYAGFNGLLAQLGPDAAAAKVKELGFDGIEPLDDPALYTPETAAALRKALDANGLRTCCYSVYATLTGPQAEATEQRLLRCAELCAVLGSPYLHHTLIGPIAPVPADRTFAPGVFEEVVERAGRIAQYAASLGVRCIYEDQGFYFNGIDGLQRFFAAMEPHAPGFCADVGNCLFVDELPQGLIDAFRERTCHVHLKDYHYQTQPLTGFAEVYRSFGGNYLADAYPGEGILALRECVQKLGPAYDGFYALEFWPTPADDAAVTALAAQIRALEG